MCPCRRKMNGSILARTRRSMDCFSGSIIVSAADERHDCFDETLAMNVRSRCPQPRRGGGSGQKRKQPVQVRLAPMAAVPSG